MFYKLTLITLLITSQLYAQVDNGTEKEIAIGPGFNTPLFVKGDNREMLWQNYSLEYFKKQKEWVEHILSLHYEAGFIFVFLHEPFYSLRKDRVGEAERRRNFWGDIFERHHVQAVINGHDHHYHHAINNNTHIYYNGRCRCSFI